MRWSARGRRRRSASASGSGVGVGVGVGGRRRRRASGSASGVGVGRRRRGRGRRGRRRHELELAGQRRRGPDSRPCPVPELSRWPSGPRTVTRIAGSRRVCDPSASGADDRLTGPVPSSTVTPRPSASVVGRPDDRAGDRRRDDPRRPRSPSPVVDVDAARAASRRRPDHDRPPRRPAASAARTACRRVPATRIGVPAGSAPTTGASR